MTDPGGPPLNVPGQAELFPADEVVALVDTEFVARRHHTEGYQHALRDIAEWLTMRTGHGVPLWARIGLAEDLRDGTWKTSPRSRRPGEVHRRVIEERQRRAAITGITPEYSPTEQAWLATALPDRARARRDAQDAHRADVARILLDEHGLGDGTPSSLPGGAR